MCGRFVMVPREVAERIARLVEAGLPVDEEQLSQWLEESLPQSAPRQEGVAAPYQPALFDEFEDGPQGAGDAAGAFGAFANASAPALPGAALDAFPGSRVPVAVAEGEPGRLKVAELTWGYPATWSKRPVFNTRTDTAAGSRSSFWRDSLEHRRCVVPTLGFYEPHRTMRAVSPRTGRAVKAQCSFCLPGHPVTFLGGIYEDDHFSVMTCEPNGWVRDVHDRMPLVLRPFELSAWLGPDYATLFDRRDVELACTGP